jgi:hypothetical protein
MKCSVVSRLSMLSLLTLLSSVLAHASAPLTYVTTVDGAKVPVSVTLQNWGLSSGSNGTQITIKDPYLESADEDYPLIADTETLQEVCKLAGAGKVLNSEAAGSENLTAGDFATFTADGTIVSDAQKHGIDPSGDPDEVISVVTCQKN